MNGVEARKAEISVMGSEKAIKNSTDTETKNMGQIESQAVPPDINNTAGLLNENSHAESNMIKYRIMERNQTILMKPVRTMKYLVVLQIRMMMICLPISL